MRKRLNKIDFSVLLGSTILLIFGITVSFGIFIYFGHIKTFFPRTKISNIDVGGKTIAEADELLRRENESYLKIATIKLVLDGKEYTTPIKNLSINFDTENTVNYVFDQTHNGLYNSIAKSISSFVKGSNWTQSFSISDQGALNQALDDSAQKTLKQPIDAKLEVINDSIQFTESQSGEMVNTLKAKSDIKDKIGLLDNSDIKLEKESTPPQINDVDLAQAYFKASLLLQNKGFNLMNKGGVIYRIDSGDLKQWLKFEKHYQNNTQETGTTQGRIAGVSTSSRDDLGVFVLPQVIREQYALEAAVDQKAIQSFVESIASRIDEQAVDAKLSIADNKVVVSQKESIGRELDKEKLIEEINLRLNSSSANDIQLPIKQIIPDIRSDNIADLGIKEKIAEGVSNFSGSPKNRINNLTIGTSKFNGAIIKPGEVASFADIVGSVDESQGYLPELVIKGTETIQELGGGMCQVSTTFYRVALNAGVPIIERHAHAYLVGYYKDGPDATVYVPSTDLKWKNDTGHYILIQTSVDAAKKKVTFDFWGTNDGRQVSVSAPVYTDIVPAPTDPYYLDDPTYPTGYLVEEEHAHDGATGTFTRTISYPDGKVKTDTIKSIYRLWPAKIRRGTGPADLAIPPKE